MSVKIDGESSFCENLKIDISKFQEYKTFRQFIRKPEDNFITFIAEYELLVAKIEENICEKSWKTLELLLACNLDNDDVENIFENLKNEKSAITYTAVKTSILDIASELDQLEENTETHDNHDFEDDTANVSDLDLTNNKTEKEAIIKEEIDSSVKEIDTLEQNDPCLIKFSKSDQDSFKTKKNYVLKRSKAEREEIRREKKRISNRRWAERERLKGKPRKKHKCDECGALVVLLSHHMKQVHTPKVPCDICGKMIGYSNMSAHLLVHKSPEIKCDQCDYLTVSMERLKGHIERSHGPKNFACELCGRQFGNSLCLSMHVKKVHNSSLKCSYCKFETSNKDSLEKHMMFKHEKSANFVCVVCNFETRDKEMLENHMRDYHGGVGLESNEKLPKRRYDCDLCDYKGTGKNALRLHKNSKHFGIRFNCDKCEFTTTQKGLLKAHTERVHLGIKHSCKYCSQELANKTSLRMHMMKKHPDDYQIFSCHLCSYRTECKDRLQRHLTGKFGKHNS